MARQMTIDDVAAACGVKPATISSYASRGQMPAPDGRTGRTPWWHESTIASWDRPGRGARTDRRPVVHHRPGAGLPTVVWVHAQGASEYLWATITTIVTRAGAVVVKHRTDLWHLSRGGCTAWEVDFTPGGTHLVIRELRAKYGDDEDLELVTTGDHSILTPTRWDPDSTDQLGRAGAIDLDTATAARAVTDALEAS